MDDFSKNHGRGIIKIFNDSVYELLSQLYPQENWIPWKFTQSPNYFWNDIKNQRKFFDYIKNDFNIKTNEDWYKITCDDIKINGGRGVLGKYNNSLFQALKNVYPEEEFLPWKFHQTSRYIWEDKENQRKYFNWLGKKLGITESIDWLDVTCNDIILNDGNGILKYYNNSLIKSISKIYPEIDWKKLENEYGDKYLQKRIEEFEKKLYIKNLDDWYRISLDQIKEIGGEYLRRKYNGIYNLLQKVYPDYKWIKSKFSSGRTKKSSQRWLKVSISSIFP